MKLNKLKLFLAASVFTSCTVFAQIPQAHDLSLQASVSFKNVELESSQTKKIVYGLNGEKHAFTSDASFPALGEAWKDPSGMIWGDIVKKDGHPVLMNQYQANSYCKSIAAELPSKEEFVRLREYMGAHHGNDENYNRVGAEIKPGYTPQVLPNLSEKNYFWTSSICPLDTDSSSISCPHGTKYASGDFGSFGYVFNSNSGFIGSGYSGGVTFSVRCVMKYK